MNVVVEDESVNVIAVMSHDDPRLRDLCYEIGRHLWIKEHGILSNLRLSDLRHVSDQVKDGLHIEASWHGLVICAFGEEWADAAMQALELFNEIVESRKDAVS